MAAATPYRPPANAFVRVMRKLYNPLGFTKGYNFILFFNFGGAMIGFCGARFSYISYGGVFCGSDASYDCHEQSKSVYERVGMILHLAAIIPAVFQFVPAIRRKVMLFHRLNGYLILLLSLIATAGSFMVARHAIGGQLETQMAIGVISIMFIGALGLSYYNVKKLQLEQHRAWMLRAWFYAGSVITLRIIFLLMSVIITNKGYFAPITCEKLASKYMLESAERVLEKFPDCQAFFDGVDPEKMVLVQAAFAAAGGKSGTQASLTLTFGAGWWLAIAMHAIGVEAYLQLTPAESERLRNVSYQRQVEAGMKNPGRAGLTADRVGDSALWVPTLPDGDELEKKIPGEEASAPPSTPERGA